MVTHDDHFNFLMTEISVFQTIHDLKPGFVLIITLYHLIAHRSCTGYIDSIVISMCSAENWNIPLSLCPGRCVRGMCMDNTTNGRPVFVQHGVGFCI